MSPISWILLFVLVRSPIHARERDTSSLSPFHAAPVDNCQRLYVSFQVEAAVFFFLGLPKIPPTYQDS